MLSDGWDSDASHQLPSLQDKELRPGVTTDPASRWGARVIVGEGVADSGGGQGAARQGDDLSNSQFPDDTLCVAF